MRYFYAILAIVVGFLSIRYSVQLTDSIGKIEWAERYLRGGFAGTYTMYRLFGLLLIILALLYIFGSFGFIVSPFAPLFGGAK